LSFVKGKQCCNHLMALFEKGAYASVAWAHTHTHTHTHIHTHKRTYTHTQTHTWTSEWDIKGFFSHMHAQTHVHFLLRTISSTISLAAKQARQSTIHGLPALMCTQAHNSHRHTQTHTHRECTLLRMLTLTHSPAARQATYGTGTEQWAPEPNLKQKRQPRCESNSGVE